MVRHVRRLPQISRVNVLMVLPAPRVKQVRTSYWHTCNDSMVAQLETFGLNI